MPFTMTPIAQVERDVPVRVPQESGGHETHVIRVTYRLLPVSEQKETREAQQAGDLPDDDLMHRDIVTIRDLLSADGKTLTYSPEVLDQLLDMPHARPALIRGWREVQANREVETGKN
tara:strand:+ start:977 stop:1330 length:354 start_codon:yes stop_codon:yes gene_type:complete